MTTFLVSASLWKCFLKTLDNSSSRLRHCSSGVAFVTDGVDVAEGVGATFPEPVKVEQKI